MWTMKVFFLLLGAFIVGSWSHLTTSHEPPPCEPSECLRAKCPKITKPDCEEAQMGLFIGKGDRCGCCDVCVPFLRENEACDPSRSHLLLSQGGHDTRAGCMEGLVCNRDTAKCETPTPSTKGPHWLEKGVEATCERSLTGEQSTYSTAHVAGKGGTTCAPGLVYRGDEDACEKPRLKRDLHEREFRVLGTESDPESAGLKAGDNSRVSPMRRAPVRTFRIRWSACNEAACDRGVCPPKTTRKSMCDGHFYPDRRCKCCGECTKMFTPEEGKSRDDLRPFAGAMDKLGRVNPGYQSLKEDVLTCIAKGVNCFQYEKCESNQMHKRNANTCKGHFAIIEPYHCNCCGICKPYLKEHAKCADMIEGNPKKLIPNCNEGLECKKSPINGEYVCQAPCPANCGKKKCSADEVNVEDCPNIRGAFKATELCACCGHCLERIKLNQPCLDESKNPIEPGCDLYMSCRNGVCSQNRSDIDWNGAGQTRQNELLETDPTAWTRLDYPQIDREGFYYPVQCEAYKCYCVATDGSHLGYVMPRFYAFNMICDCAREKYYGKTTLKCDHLGNYKDLDLAGIPRPPAALSDK